jgi:thymidylate synthase (FAD)
MVKKLKVLDKGFVRLIDSMGDDSSIVQAARVSYGKGTKTVSDDRNLIRYLMRHRHTTPFEMCTFKFHIKAPIFVVRQWHRHRTFSFNEVSGRYSELPNECYVPKDEHFTKQDPHNKQGGTNEMIQIQKLSDESIEDWTEKAYVDFLTDSWSWSNEFESMQEHIHEQYDAFKRTGVRRELARINLPLAQYTEMYASINLHNLFHFLKLRMDSHAQFEIREYANAIYELIKTRVPFACEAFEDYVVESISFSKLEKELLSTMLKKTKITNDNKISKRELKDFESKIENLLKLKKIIKEK